MSNQTGVFICPSCQSVVRSDAPLEEGIICGECDHKFGLPGVSGGGANHEPLKAAAASVRAAKGGGNIIRNLTSNKAPLAKKGLLIEKIEIPMKTLDEAIKEDAVSRGEGEIMPDGSRRVRHRKKKPKKQKNKSLILFLLGWLSVVTIIVLLFKMNGDETEEAGSVADEGKRQEQIIEHEILKRVRGDVRQNFYGFLGHPTNKGREQFISDSAELALPFMRYYNLQQFTKPDSQMGIAGQNVIKISEKDFGIETIWQDKEGHRLGTVHLWDGESWKLDWENFTRYSTESWSRFRAEIGAKEGTFRLLVRKRETGNEAERFYLSFYRAPDLYDAADAFKSSESPEVELATKSELAQRFLRLWEKHKAGEVPYDSILGVNLDPPNHLRLTVVLAWEKNEYDESVMVLKDIVGVSWFGRVIQNLHREGNQIAKEKGSLSVEE